MTSGIIGKLEIDGKQVGGFRDWLIDVLVYKDKSKTTAIADSYWMFRKVKEVVATFYFSLDGELVVANQSLVTLQLPNEYALNKRIQAPLEMVFNGD